MYTEEEEATFDINKILKELFLSLKTYCSDNNIELIYDMDRTVPHELRGNSNLLYELLRKVLLFVFEKSHQNEFILSLSAPKDFVFEDPLSVKIRKTGIGRDKISAFLEIELQDLLHKLNGKIVYNEVYDLYLDIPFTISELGFRRHYRLPKDSMLNKKILIIVQSKNLAASLRKMFNYFNYEVDTTSTYVGSSLDGYDLVILEDKLMSHAFYDMVFNEQNKRPLKCVLLGDGSTNEVDCSAIISTHIFKPVTQESIFELIIAMFEFDTLSTNKKSSSTVNNDTKKVVTPFVRDNFKVQNHPDSALHKIIAQKTEIYASILDTEIGLENAKKTGLNYAEELDIFFKVFTESDLYFRQIVEEKSVNKLKEFCIDLERESKMIGAQSMSKLVDTVELLIMHNKLDMLSIYPGRYHEELEKLMTAITTYLRR